MDTIFLPDLEDEKCDVWKQVGINLKVEFSKRGLTQTYVAQSLGVKDARISTLITGRAQINPVELCLLRGLFGIEPNALFPPATNVTHNDGNVI